MLPFLLDARKCQAALNWGQLREKIEVHTGELAAALATPSPEVESAWSMLAGGAASHGETNSRSPVRGSREHEMENEWTSAVARELLLLDPGVRTRWLAGDGHLGAARPFGPDKPALDDLGGCRCAMAFYPLAGRSGSRSGTSPALGLVAWPEGHHAPFILEPVGTEVDGDSWALARALTSYFSVHGDQPLRIELARRWIVTGGMHDKRVAPVDLGNKTSLYPHHPDRIWLVPGQNYRNRALTRYEELPYRTAHDLNDAIAHISAKGSTRGGDMDAWPSSVELHSFVSDAREPVLMAAHFMKTGKCVLWRSSDAYKPHAETLAYIIKNRLKKDVELKERDDQLVASDDLAAAERTLLAELSAKLSGSNVILFNITQGNTLMRSAALLIARRYPNLWLIYRNFDIKTQPVFDLIRFPGSEAMTQRINMTREGSCANWDNLLANNKDVTKASDEEWANYYFPGKPEGKALP